MQELPVSITNWVILSDYLVESSDLKIFVKVVQDYLILLPLYKIYEIFTLAERRLTKKDFELLIEELWKNVHELEGDQCLRIRYTMQH